MNLRLPLLPAAALIAAACAHAGPAPASSASYGMAAANPVTAASAVAAAPEDELDGGPGAAEGGSDFVTDLDKLIAETPDAEALGAATAPAPAVDGGIPLVYNKRVEKLIRYFQGRGRERFELWLSRSGAYIPLMQGILVDEGLPPDLVYLALIESGFSPYAYSSASAVGFWQFITPTGRRYGLRIDDWVDERRNPEKATRAAARYLRDLYGMFNDWHLAAAGYNAGENKIARAMRKYDADNFWDLVEGRYLKAETKDYVPKLIAAITIAKDPAAYGFNPVYQQPVTHAVVTVAGGEDLRRLAYAAGVTFGALKRLNPELRRWLTPPGEAYVLAVPVGAEVDFATRLVAAPVDGGLPFHRVTLGKRDTLETVAALHQVSVADLKLANPGLRVKPGAEVVVPVGDDGVRFAERPPRTRWKTRAVVKVKHGDTLTAIARRYRVSAAAIAEYNGLDGELRAGQRLKIPGKASQPSGRKAKKRSAKVAAR